MVASWRAFRRDVAWPRSAAIQPEEPRATRGGLTEGYRYNSPEEMGWIVRKLRFLIVV
jgi:hypothetical protein